MPKTKPFDRYYEDYDRWFEQNRYAYESELGAIRHFVPETGKGVEIGSGSGRFAIPLGIHEGIEPSYAMRKIANQAGMRAEYGVAENLPMKDHVYDFALMVTTICFVDDPQKSVNEMFRILKPGGLAIIGFVDRDSPLGQLYQEHKLKSRFYADASFFNPEEVEEFMERAGFNHIEFIQTIFEPLDEMNASHGFTKGHGEGSFVVVRGKKE